MPIFRSVKGFDVFIPAHAIAMAEAPEGLVTRITFALPGGAAGQIEVKETCEKVGLAIVDELVAQ